MSAALSAPAWALHFDVELRTSGGPVAGSRITTHLFGDLTVTGPVPIDAQTGYRIFWGYFGDLEGGPYLTDDPGFQAFGGTFLRREEIHFRARGSLLYWNPATGRWGPAAAGTKLALFGGIPIDVIVGYTENPTLWQAQYDYWSAGSRFTAQGVEGPPSAVIDDAGASGSFHAHLDWKITAAGAGVPAVGAYLVTLELFSTALHNGAPKYLPAAPIHIIFERGISEAQLQAAIQARVTPPPPPRCTAASLSWIVAGTGCSAEVNDTDSGATLTVRDLIEPALGSAQFTCQAGQWSGASQASCAVPPPPPPPPAPCPQALLGWTVEATTCQALVPGTPSGLSVALADNVEPNLGTARFTCSAGQWSSPAQAVCNPPPPPPPPRPCTPQTLGWQVAGLSCSASAPGTPSGSSVGAVDAEGPQVGSAVFACTNGTWGAAQAASCSTLPPAGCSAAVLPWTQAGQSCSAAVPATPSGSGVLAVDSDAPATGNAQFSCSNSSWGSASAATCTAPPPSPPPPPPPPRPCTTQTLGWQVAGVSCSASAPGTSSGSSVGAVDADGPQVGSAVFACTNGNWGAALAASCSTLPPAGCSAAVLPWTQTGQSCSAAVPATPSGSGMLAVDSDAPATGSAQFSCSNGSWGSASAATCTAPPPPCSAQALAWSQAGLQCVANAPALESGLSLVLGDTLAPTLGSARFSCANGSWSAPDAATCTIPPPRDCAPQSLNWSVGASSCQSAAPASASGRVVLLQDLLAPLYGSARFTCSDGQWLAAVQPAPQCGALAQSPSRSAPRAPWQPPQTLPWQGP